MRVRPPRGPGVEQTLLVCVLIGTAQMSWGVVVPVLPVLIERLGMGVVVLGPVIAAFAVGRVLANLPAGMALRWWRPRPYLHVVMVVLAAVTMATGFLEDPVLVVAARLVAGLFGGAAVTIGYAVLVGGAPAGRRGSVMALANGVQMSAAAVGAVIGGAVLTVSDIRATFVVAAIPGLLALLWDLLRPASRYWSALGARSETSPVRSRPAPGGGRILVALSAVTFAIFFARFAGEQGIVPVLAYEVGGLSPLGLGLAMAAGTLVSMAVLPLAGRLADHGARRSLTLTAAVSAMLALVLFPLAAVPWAFAGLSVLYSVATVVSNIVPGVVTAEAFPPERLGYVVGVTRTAGDLGAAVGPLLVFAAADVAGYGSAMAVLVAVLLVAVAWFVAVLPRRPSAAEAGDES